MYSLLTREEFNDALDGFDHRLLYDDYEANPFHLHFSRETMKKLNYENMVRILDASELKWKMEQIKAASSL